jgi:glyoxylase-like metal-dependent hydrolase (beta-lactamase superfamily II)
VREVQTGLWHWEGPHPEWSPRPGSGWPPLVSSYAIDDGERLLLFDPLAIPGEIEALAAERETAIVLTGPWHRRDAITLAERLAAPMYVPPPDPPDPESVPGHVFTAGDKLPVGVEAFPGMEPNDLVLWVESRRALVVGDTLIHGSEGLFFPAEPGEDVRGVPAEQILEALQQLLELPVELVLPTHGAPTDRTALEHALS